MTVAIGTVTQTFIICVVCPVTARRILQRIIAAMSGRIAFRGIFETEETPHSAVLPY